MTDNKGLGNDEDNWDIGGRGKSFTTTSTISWEAIRLDVSATMY